MEIGSTAGDHVMADQSDVENALVVLTAAALYPDGPGTKSISGMDYQIYRGWPNSAALDGELAAGKTNVTIFPMAEPGRNTTRHLQLRQSTASQSSLTATTSDMTITFNGNADAGQTAGIIIDGLSYVYRTQAGDTPEIVAANLAASARPDWIVVLSGPTLTIPGASKLSGRVVSDASVVQEVRRQEQNFRVSCWCPDPESRDTAAAAIDYIFSRTNFVNLADGTRGRLRYHGSLVFDQSQDAMLYRRDLIYEVEYSTTVIEHSPTMLFGNLVYNYDTLTT